MSLIGNTTELSTADICVDHVYSTEVSNFTARFPADEVVVEVNLWSLLLLVFPVTTAFGNALVCVSVWTERSLQTVTNYFIVSLAIADLMVAVLVMPLAVYVEVSLYRSSYSIESTTPYSQLIPLILKASFYPVPSPIRHIGNLFTTSLEKYNISTKYLAYNERKLCVSLYF